MRKGLVVPNLFFIFVLTKHKAMQNISKEDYVIVDKSTNKTIEPYDIVYHHTSIVELINNGFKLKPNEEIVCVAELSIEEQIKHSEAIENCK